MRRPSQKNGEVKKRSTKWPLHDDQETWAMNGWTSTGYMNKKEGSPHFLVNLCFFVGD